MSEEQIQGSGSGVAVIVSLGFVLCKDGRFRRRSVNDSLAVEVDDYRLTVFAETDDQNLRIQVASFQLDGDRFARWLSVTDGQE